MSGFEVGQRVVLKDGVLFGPLRVLHVTRVCKNGNLHAKATPETDGRQGDVSVIVTQADAEHAPEDPVELNLLRRNYIRKITST